MGNFSGYIHIVFMSIIFVLESPLVWIEGIVKLGIVVTLFCILGTSGTFYGSIICTLGLLI